MPAAAGRMGAVLVTNAVGLKTTARLQLGLAGVLAALLLVAVITALPESKAEHWTPFAPHGLGAVGTAEPSRVPIADLMAAGLGGPGRTATAALAVLLTMGTMNAYVAAAVKLAGALAEEREAPAVLGNPAKALAIMAVVAGALLVPLAAGVLSLEGLVRACSAAFVAVYVTATAAGIKLLDGAPRTAAAIAFVAALYAAFSMTAASRSTAVANSC